MEHKKQIKKLTGLGLKIHPLKEKNCWEIYASTPTKATKRFEKIKKIYPKAITINVDNNFEISFGVNLYGE